MDEDMLRNKVMPQIAESIIRLSKGAPTEKKEEIQQILTEHGMLPDCNADMAKLRDALRCVDKAITMETTAVEEYPQGSATPSSSATFKHVFTPKHPGSIDNYYELQETLGEGSFGTIYKGRSKCDSPSFHLDAEVGSEMCQPVRAIKTVSSSMAP